MTIDLVCAGAIALFAFLGYISGFWMQVMRIGVLVAAYLLAGAAGRPLGPFLASSLGVPVLLGRLLGSAIAFLLLYSILSTVGWSLLRRRRRKKELEQDGQKPDRASWNSTLGAVFGGAKAFAILFVMLCAIVLFDSQGGKIRHAIRSAGMGYEKSVAVRFARENNLLAGLHLPVVGDLATVVELNRKPELRKKALADPNVQKLLDHPRVKALLNDRKIIELSKNRDVSALLGHPKVNALLEDAEIQKLLGEIDLGELVR
ncbi:MAG: CvpA family protein [Deltaproteobacteria bacterium]|nr:CvpA family protein [Deltaproteobacteria bacterium]